jgi:hypothetical protein
MGSTNKKYLMNTENYIKEESSEENQLITEDEDDYNIGGDGVMNRRKIL